MSKSLTLRILIIIFFFLFPFSIITANSGSFQEQDTLSGRTLTHEDLVRGERLFHGLVYPRNISVNCSGCHNTTYSDTLNWNPDAYEISRKYLEKTDQDLSRILLKPSGVKMEEVHGNIKYTDEEITLIKAYMDELAHGEMKAHKPVITNLLIFILAFLLLTFSIVDLFITKKIRKQWILLLTMTITGVVVTWYLVVEALAIGHSPGYGPDQPIKFSHAIHAGQNKTDCIYCHSYASHSKASGIPSTNVCMNCHLIVRSGKKSGAFEIAKVTGGFEKMEPISWVRVYNLPDHAFFNHAQHVTAGGIACQECHGAVQEMDRITLNNELTMGWCVNCHRTRNVNFEINRYYSQYKDLKVIMKEGEKVNITPDMLGGTECMKCHY